MFKPVNDNHSILEVHFVLETERPWLQEDKSVIERGDQLWGDVLPGKFEGQQIFLQFGPQVQGVGIEHPPRQMPPLAYRTVARDGSREWELAFEGQALRITCGKYSRWEQVWKIALNLFQMAGRTLKNRETGIRAVELTYQDLFLWEGLPKDYNVGKLLTNEHCAIGGQTLDHGPSWHCHNGWMKEQKDWEGEPYLERIHLDGNQGLIRQENKPAIMITTTARLGHGGKDPLFTLQNGFNDLRLVGQRKDNACGRFEWLHERTKEIFCTVLRDDMQRAIGLRST